MGPYAGLCVPAFTCPLTANGSFPGADVPVTAFEQMALPSLA
ncbi:hypothetical protein [Streptomyces sp. 4F14]